MPTVMPLSARLVTFLDHLFEASPAFENELLDSSERAGLTMDQLELRDALPAPQVYLGIALIRMPELLPAPDVAPCRFCHMPVTGYALMCWVEDCPQRCHVHCAGLSYFKNIDQLNRFEGEFACPLHDDGDGRPWEPPGSHQGASGSATPLCQACLQPATLVSCFRCRIPGCKRLVHEPCLPLRFATAEAEAVWTCKVHCIPRFFVEGQAPALKRGGNDNP